MWIKGGGFFFLPVEMYDNDDTYFMYGVFFSFWMLLVLFFPFFLSLDSSYLFVFLFPLLVIFSVGVGLFLLSVSYDSSSLEKIERTSFTPFSSFGWWGTSRTRLGRRGGPRLRVYC